MIHSISIFKNIIFRLAVVLLCVFLNLSCNTSQHGSNAEKQYTSMVYPILDTNHSRWFFFSSASRPFGMVNLSPDTEVDGDWGGGYRYDTDTVKGFSHVHAWQLAGPSIMPINPDLIHPDGLYRDY